MNNNLDDWLNSLGLPVSSPDASAVNVMQQPSPPLLTDNSLSSPSDEPEELESQPEPISPSDLDLEEILSENGFTEPLQEPEEVHEDEEEDEEEEEEEESNDETIDLGNGFSAHLPRHVLEASNSILNTDSVATTAPSTPSSEESMPSQVSPENLPDNSLLIPPNSPTLLMDDSTSRFSGMEWFREIQSKTIILAGLGGIGSNVAFQLARMQPRGLVMYDDDMVETANMSGQLYQRGDAGDFKVNAINKMIQAYTNISTSYAVSQKFTEYAVPADIMICGFDNMTARRTFFNSWFNHVMSRPEEERKNCLFLDGRLSVDTLQIYCITGDDAYNQEKYVTECLFTDAEAEETICSMKQTTYLACMIGSLMVNLFTNFCANLCDPMIPYDLPFFTEYSAQNMLFKTEN